MKNNLYAICVAALTLVAVANAAMIESDAMSVQIDPKFPRGFAPHKIVEALKGILWA